MDWVYRGRAWKFGDNIANDQIIATAHVTQYNPEALAEHCFEVLRPGFHRGVQKGDVVVGGENFGQGIFHIHAYLALKALGLGLITESASRGTFRLGVSAGLAMLPFCPSLKEKVAEGEELEVDFQEGTVINLTRGVTMNFSPLPPALLEIIEAGGRKEFLRKKWRERIGYRP